MRKTQAKHSPEQSADPLAAEERAFRLQHVQLIKRFAGQYVGFYGGRLIDRDEDDEILAARMFKKLGDVSFYIARLEETPTVCEVPSPELAN